ncbi:hypothetical protein [Pseudohalocynthiibacter sp. F2068]|nr:hypothetical protein [Pseudohalocynthiibacter sp. F2068]MCK0103869.1 hypothetical protein [Pseudohalocynthiibacter sp. F2068]
MSSDKNISTIAAGILTASLLGAPATSQTGLDNQSAVVSDGPKTVVAV